MSRGRLTEALVMLLTLLAVAAGQVGISGGAGMSGGAGIKVEGGGGGGAAYVGGCAAVVTTGSTVSCLLDHSVSAGDMIAVGAAMYGGGTDTLSSITDNCNTGGTSNTYAALTAERNSYNSMYIRQGAATVGANTASCTVTVHCTGTCTTWLDMAASAASGVTAVDASTYQYNTSATPSSGNITLTATDFVFSWAFDSSAGNSTFTAGSGFSGRKTAGDTGINIASEDKVTSTSPSAGTWSSNNGSAVSYVGVIALKP